MKGAPAIYLGRIVEKKNFRAFIYNANSEKRLVDSWEEFEENMQSGLWFSCAEDAEESKKSKTKSKQKPRRMSQVERVKEPEDVEEMLPDDGSVFEVTNDSLPNKGE